MEYPIFVPAIGYRVIYQLRGKSTPCSFQSTYKPLSDCMAGRLREAGGCTAVSDTFAVAKYGRRYFLQDPDSEVERIPDPFEGFGFN